MNARQWLFSTWRRVLPASKPRSIVQWARQHCVLPGSTLSQAYDPDVTPWTKEPIEASDDGVTRFGTFVKPIQCGGSAVGLVALNWRLATAPSGDLQYNWPTNEKAAEKWSKVIEKTIRACRPVMRRVSGDLTWKKNLVIFPHCNLTVQGVRQDTAATSDSITFQLNEELHDVDGGWFPGRLEQMHGRLTAVWNGVAFQISNAGRSRSELHQVFEAGTQQHWQILCPDCHQYHAPHTRWDDAHPELGGLRYDATGCRLPGGDYDYTRLASTIYLQLPCGYRVHEDPTLRRQLSLSGRYSPPTNPGAPLSHRSWTLEAVSVDYIPFINLIRQKHSALKALKYGDPEPWNTYLRERECVFASDDTRPTVQQIVLSTTPKDRSGLPQRTQRFGAADRQQGSFAAGELPHWWQMIADCQKYPAGHPPLLLAPGGIHIALLYESKVLTNEDLVANFRRHEVPPACVVADSGWDAENVYLLCLTHGYNAIKGDGKSLFTHPDGGRKIFSIEKPLHTMVNQSPRHPYLTINGRRHPDPREPLFWFYLQSGIMDRLAWCRAEDAKIRSGQPGMVRLDIPADVSEDFKAHLDSWSREERRLHDGQPVPIWRQHKTRDDLFFCLCYIVMQIEMAGLIGAAAAAQATTPALASHPDTPRTP